MISRCAVIILAAALIGCGDYPMEPNTEVGLRVWVEVFPRTVSISDTAASLRIRLRVLNPSRSEITVITGGPPYRFSLNPIASSGLFGGIRITNDTDSLNAGPNTDWWGQPIYTFAPRSSTYEEIIVSLKKWRAGGWKLLPGEYRLRGWFNGREGKSATFVLRP